MKSIIFKKLKFPFIVLLLILGFFVGKELILAYSGCGLKAYDGNEIIEFACEEPGEVTSPLRIAKGGQIYGIPLVNPYHQYASNFRIMINGEIKALRKIQGPYDETSNWGVEFPTGDTEFIDASYYDFFPGGLHGIPISHQPETIDALPWGDPLGDVEGGTLITYVCRPNFGYHADAAAAYISSDGIITGVSSVDELGQYEGYFSSSVDTDPVSGNSFIMSVNDNFTSFLSFDDFNLFGYPGGWSTSFEVIEQEDNQFIETEIYIDSSPSSEYRRIYAYAADKWFYNTNTYGSDGFGKIIFAYNDFYFEEGGPVMEFNNEWTYQIIDYFDDLQNDSIVSHKAMAVKDNRIAFMGYNEDNEIFVVYNDNYGQEGEWFVDTQLMEFDIFNMGNYFSCDNLYTSFKYSQNMNVIFDNEGNLHMIGAMGIYGNDGCTLNPPDEQKEYTYVKHFVYNFDDEEFHFNNVYPSGNYEIDEIYIPGDADNDGDYDGNVVKYRPVFHPEEKPNCYNNYKIVSSKDNEYLLAVWQNSIKSRLYPYQWGGYPEIVFSISSDNGRTWSEPIIMNAKLDDDNYFSELESQLPVYIYPSDDFEVTYNGNEVNFEVLMFYYDDTGLGSYEKFNQGGISIGILKYAELEFTGTLD